MSSSGGTGVETKVAAGSATTIAAGYIAWILVTYVPGIKDTIPLDLQGQLPVVVAFVLASVAAYLAPHTPRPDLAAPAVTPEEISAKLDALLTRLGVMIPAGTITAADISAALTQPPPPPAPGPGAS